MKDSEVYLRAAKMVDRMSFCHSCSAIDAVCREFRCRHRERYADIFCPIQGVTGGAWLLDDVEASAWGKKEKKKWRVLALLFMHQIAKDKERI